MSRESERRDRKKGGTGSGAGRGDDFADHPAYRTALRLCAQVLDMESKFPDDEQPLLYNGLKRCAIESGSFLAAGFGRSAHAARLELWEQARSRIMEARHHVLVARMRYVLDVLDVREFETLYFELIDGIDVLIGGAAGAGVTGRARDSSRRGRRSR